MSIAVYIFVLDWRMGLASLVTTVIGIVVASQSSKTYAVRWQGAVEVGRRMANAIVEYVGGIQVVKAFSQSAAVRGADRGQKRGTGHWPADQQPAGAGVSGGAV